MLTHRNMVANLRQIHAWLAPAIKSDGEVFVAALPLYHVFALQVNGFVPLMIGASNLMIANPRDIPALVKALRGTRFTAIPGVNTLFNALLNNKDFAGLDFSQLHLTIGGGMAVQRAVAERWQSVTGKPLIEAYGLTETSPAAIANPLNIDAFNGAIGLPMPSTEIAIRDDDGRDLKLGEAGELCIKGPQVMGGYWNRPDETEKVMTADGFLRTGDIARVDERGFVYVVDRKKDMINVSGFNVYPNEIEDVAMGHPGVLEAGAVGVPDARTGEAVKLVVVRKDMSLTEAALIAYCRQHLTGYKTPRQIEFRESLPHTDSWQDPAPRIARRGRAGWGVRLTALAWRPHPKEKGDAPKARPDEGSGTQGGRALAREPSPPTPLPTARRKTGVLAERPAGEGSRSGRARFVERLHVGSCQRKLGRAHKALGLFDRGGAGDRRGDAGPRHGPGERNFRRLRFVAGRHGFERVEDTKPAGIEIGLDPVAARTLGEIGFAPVLARQEALGEAEIGDDADLLALAEIGEAAFELVPVGEIVFRLENLVARQSLRL